MSLVERISNKIGIKIAVILNLDKDKEEIIIYGAFSLFQTMLAIFWTLVIGGVFKVLWESIVVLFAISILRKYSGGVHSSSPKGCIVIGTAISVGLAMVSKNLLCFLSINLIIMLIVIGFTYSYYNTLKYAPVDSPAKPIKNMEVRSRLKKLSILIINVLALIIIILFYIFSKYRINGVSNIINCICLGIVWQSFTLTFIGGKVLTKLDKKLQNFL